MNPFEALLVSTAGAIAGAIVLELQWRLAFQKGLKAGSTIKVAFEKLLPAPPSELYVDVIDPEGAVLGTKKAGFYIDDDGNLCNAADVEIFVGAIPSALFFVIRAESARCIMRATPATFDNKDVIGKNTVVIRRDEISLHIVPPKKSESRVS